MSEKALRYLSEAEFTIGLAAGVPDNLTVTHKFGEHSAPAAPNIKQLHDCGIVYYPNSPYLLCIMPRGADLMSLADAIREISGIVYREIEAQDIDKASPAEARK